MLCLHILWLLNGRTPVRATEFPGAFISGAPDTLIRFVESPLLGLLNLALIFALAGVCICLLGRWVAGTVLAISVLISLSAANELKQQMLQEPILWQDLTILRDTISLLRGFISWTHFVLLGIGAGLLLLTWWLDSQLRLPRLKLRLRGMGLVFCCLIPMLIASLPTSVVDQYIGEPELNDTTRDYQQVLLSYSRSHGLLLSLLFSWKSGEVQPPADYDEHNVEIAATRLVDDVVKPAPAVRPHVIAIMYESLWDVTQLPGVTITPDPIATFRNPPGNGETFRLLSPVFGRPTANVEFEFLTGMSMSQLPSGVIPYMGMIHNDIPALPKLFRDNGYRALAIHPYNCEFWRRDTVYPKLGFERFEDIVGFYPSDVKGRYVSDDAVASHIIRCIDEATKPTFLFAVTMQNHAPHTRDEYANYDVTVTDHITDLNHDALTAYTQGVYDADRSLRRLIDHFSKSQQPVVVVAFGDHLPPISNLYTVSGFRDIGRDNIPAQRVGMRATPAVLWTNLPGPLPKLAPTISPNFLTPTVVDLAGIRDPFFTVLLGEGRNLCPGLTSYVCSDADGQASLSEPAGTRRFLHDYALLQHDLLSGNGYAEPWLRNPGRRSASATTEPWDW